MNFLVTFNGMEQTVYPARVSAMQFNQVYQGKQRPLDQTLISHFVSIELTKSGELVVESADFNGKAIEIRPFDSGIQFKHENDRVMIPLEHPGQFVIEAGDRDHVLHVFVNPPFHYEHTENELYFGPGVHEAGTISPVSGQTVCFDRGAVVYGQLKLIDVYDVKIIGPGILDSSKVPRDEGNCKTNPDFLMNSCFVARNCRNILVRDIVFRDAPVWAVVTRNGCRDVTFDNIKLIGMWRYNSDGIDICASQNVTIKNSFIRSFDDCFVARGACLYGETEDVDHVVVENCVLWCDWGKCLEVWAGDHPCVIRDVICRNIHVVHTSHLIADVTTWFGSSDTKIRDITFENVTVDIGETLYDPQIQNEKNPVYLWRTGWQRPMIRIDCERLGPNLGNQKAGKCEDLSSYNLKYENITIRNFRFNKAEQQYTMLVDASNERLKMEQIKAIDLDMKIEKRGPVEISLT